jgi:hypothetical protein
MAASHHIASPLTASYRIAWSHLALALRFPLCAQVVVEQEGNRKLHELLETNVDKVNPPKFDQSEDMAELPNL